MKHFNRITAWLLAVLLVCALAGCGTQDVSEQAPAASEEEVQAAPESVTEAPEAETAVPEPEPEASAPEAPESVLEPEPVERVAYELPLFEGGKSFSFWSMYNVFDGGRMEFPFWNQLAEATGVDVEFVEVNIDVCNEKYNLMLASGDLTDVIWEKSVSLDGSAAYPGGYEKALEDGIYLDLTELVETQCPNYYSLLQENPSALRDISLDDGRLYSFSQIYSSPMGDVRGNYVQNSVLEAIGYDHVPETVEEWLDCWKAMVDANACTYYVSDLEDSGIARAFGASDTFLVDRERGEIFYGAIAEEYREYIAYVAEMYAYGILNDNYYAEYASNQDIDAGLYATFLTRNGGVENLTFDVTAIKPMYLEDNPAAQPKLVNYDNYYAQVASDLQCCVTSACTGETLDVVLRWFDFLYSDYGIQISNYGFDEGVSYEYVDGEIQLTADMLLRDENNRIQQMLYTMQTGPSYIYSDIETPLWTEERAEAEAILNDFEPDDCIYMTLPPISLTAEESNQISAYLSDISDYVETESLAWITGAKALTDESWAAFTQTIGDMGIDECVKLYQAAYDRYQDR